MTSEGIAFLGTGGWGHLQNEGCKASRRDSSRAARQTQLSHHDGLGSIYHVPHKQGGLWEQDRTWLSPLSAWHLGQSWPVVSAQCISVESMDGWVTEGRDNRARRPCAEPGSMGAPLGHSWAARGVGGDWAPRVLLKWGEVDSWEE